MVKFYVNQLSLIKLFMRQVTNCVSERITSIDALRGIAALGVCIFHITNGNDAYLSDDNFLKAVGSYGWLGVEVFFVISGFIIPYSMYKGRYTINKIKTFLGKRISRIDPPYFFIILIVIALNYLSTLSPYYRGSGFEVDLRNLIFHIGYLNGIMDEPWLSPIFWTLAIEFQFYLFIALCFPLLIHSSGLIRYLLIISILASGFIFPSSVFFFKYSALFVIGILIFYLHAKVSTVRNLVLPIFCVLVLCYVQLGFLPILAALGTLLMILLPIKVRFLEFLGMISYSLYLIHIPIGGRIINLSINFVEQEFMRSLVSIGAIVFSIACAYLFFRLIEAPSIRLSKSIKYSRAISENRSSTELILPQAQVINK